MFKWSKRYYLPPAQLIPSNFKQLSTFKACTEEGIWSHWLHCRTLECGVNVADKTVNVATKQRGARLTRVGNRWTIGSGEGGCESCHPENHQTWKEGKRRRRWWCMRTDIYLDDIRGKSLCTFNQRIEGVQFIIISSVLIINWLSQPDVWQGR